MADLASGYNVVEKIGTGARSTIYKVVDPKTGQTFALKRVIREPHEDARFLEQAITEHEIASITNHPCLRRSFELKRIRRWAKLVEVQVVMEYVQGVSLEQHRPTDVTEIVGIFIKAAEGLDSLHRQGLLHTDLKPNNILVCQSGDIKIIDFGQGCQIGFRKPRIQGTPDYIAPEQVERRPLSQRTDIFNFGATLYWVLTGKAFPTRISKASQSGDISVLQPRTVPAPQDLNPAVPTALSRLVMESCQDRPNDRPRDMRTVINRLESVHHILTKEGAAQRPAAEAPAPAVEAPARPAEPPHDDAVIDVAALSEPHPRGALDESDIFHDFDFEEFISPDPPTKPQDRSKLASNES